MSIRDRLSSPLLATQTTPGPAARAAGSAPTRIVATTPLVAASISVTLPSEPLATQTSCADIAIAVGFEPTSNVLDDFVGFRIDALHGAFAAVRDPQGTEAVHQRVRVLPNLDGVVQGSVSVENSDAVRWQRGQRVLRFMAQDDAGHDASRGHHCEDDADDKPPRAQPRSATARARLSSWLGLRFAGGPASA